MRLVGVGIAGGRRRESGQLLTPAAAATAAAAAAGVSEEESRAADDAVLRGALFTRDLLQLQRSEQSHAAFGNVDRTLRPTYAPYAFHAQRSACHPQGVLPSACVCYSFACYLLPATCHVLPAALDCCLPLTTRHLRYVRAGMRRHLRVTCTRPRGDPSTCLTKLRSGVPSLSHLQRSRAWRLPSKLGGGDWMPCSAA